MATNRRKRRPPLVFSAGGRPPATCGGEVRRGTYGWIYKCDCGTFYTGATEEIAQALRSLHLEKSLANLEDEE